MKFKFTKNKVIASALIIIVLASAFWYGGGAPGLQGWGVLPPSTDEVYAVNPDNMEPEEHSEDTPDGSADELGLDESSSNISEKDDAVKKEETPAGKFDNQGIESHPVGMEGNLSATEKIELAKELAGGSSSPKVEKGSKSYSEGQGMVIDVTTGKDKYLTDPVPEGKPVPVEPQNVKISDVEYTCTLSVRCDTILDNIQWLDKEKVELVPEDGVIFPETKVTFYEGESVFNVLQREMKKAKIHIEFVNTPMYNSVYIEGINNLYEFDCGELSGWMYKVNGWFPNYGASRYQLKDGDIIKWVYTCDLGVDVGGFYAVGE